jgi:xylulokinase
MSGRRLSLGLDLSTQSISAVVLDIDLRTKVFEHSLDYCSDARLNGYGIRREDYILPPDDTGEASQPPAMFFAAIDVILDDLAGAVDTADIVVVNSSGQQHGHLYLNADAPSVFSRLTADNSTDSPLAILLEDSLAWDRAPIWMTSATAEQAGFIREHIGGKERAILLSGSDVPLRFTGVVMRYIAQRYPDVYQRTERVLLISSLPAAVLTGNSLVPLDFGNACGTSLMDYSQKRWSDELVEAAALGLPGGAKAFKSKLPPLAAPDSKSGTMAAYFVKKYGFSPYCRILVGSGDNPQSKVPVSGDLLSLGTSFVNMVATDGKTYDMNGYASAMYDGLGRPFMFGCRTNGAMVWDRLRAMYGMEKEEFTQAEQALRQVPVARSMVFWQPANESFPPSASYDIVRTGDAIPDFGTDYSGLIETSLASVYYYSRAFNRSTAEPLYVTGGAAASPGVMRRVAAIWNRAAVPVGKGGASLGAAVAGACAFLKSEGEHPDIDRFTGAYIRGKENPVLPLPEDIVAFHGPGKYLEKFAAEETRLRKTEI